MVEINTEVNTELANDYQPSPQEVIDEKIQKVSEIKAKLDSYKFELKELSDMKRYIILIHSIGNKTDYRMRDEYDSSKILESYKQFLQEKIDSFYTELKDCLK